MQLENEDDDDYDYDNDLSSASDSDEDGSEGASASLEEEDTKLRKNRLLCSVVRTNNDYSLSAFVQFPDPSSKAPAVLGTVELQALTFFVSRLVVWAGGFHEGDPSIYARCLQWNLIPLFSKCNKDGSAGCWRC